MRALLALVLLLVLAPAATAREVASVPAGGGARLVVEDAPFRLVLRDARAREVVATVAGTRGLPVRPPGLDGPQPLEPLSAAGAAPAVGWVLGARAGALVPVSFFAGNRLFGAEAGGVVAVTGVRSASPGGGGLDLVLRTSLGADAPARVRPLAAGGVTLDLEAPRGLPVVSTLVSLTSPDGEALTGLGGRKDAYDQRGTLRNVWVEQQNLSDERLDGVGSVIEPDSTFPNGAQAAYHVQSSLFGSRGWVAWTAGSALQRLDLARGVRDVVRWGVAAPSAGFRLAGGRGLEDASRAFTAAVGRAPAPPRWAYLPWLDVLNEGEGEAAPNGARFDGGPRVQRDLDEIVARSAEHGIPVGVLGVEGWHKVADGEGPRAKAYFAGLRRRGLHLAAYWNPFTAEAGKGYAAARDGDLLVRDALTGRPFPIVTNRGNASFLVDFAAPGAGAYWKAQLDRSADLGFEGFMEDFGEQVVDGMATRDGAPAQLAHNRYPLDYHAAGRAAIDAQARERPGFAPWFYVRAGFTGTSAHTTGVFPGDESTDWSPASGLPSVVPAMLNHALGGMTTFTTDVGGYLDLLAPRTTPELLTRWTQLAALTPVLRVHNSTGRTSLFPWEAGDAALDAFRRYARLKVRLVDLVDRWTRRAARDGTVGPVRPMVLEDPAMASVEDQWLLGRDVLAAPVLRRGQRERTVRLPAGRWRAHRVGAQGEWVPDGGAVAGPATVRVTTPLRDVPVLLREPALRLAATCRGGRLRLDVRAAMRGSVLRARYRIGARRLRGTALRRVVAPRAGRVRLEARLEDGRVVRRSRTLAPCRA